MMLVIGIPFWMAAIVGTLIQGRSIRSLVSPLRPFRWVLAGKSVLLVSSLTIIIAVIPIPGMSHLTPNLEFTGLRLEHALWLMPLLLFTLVQTSGEDAFFKGYLLRQLGAVIRISWIAPMFVVVVFVILHVGNPDMKDNLWMLIPMFVVNELLAIYLLMRSGGMEIPLVLHWLNNVYIFLFVAERGTQSNDLTLWVYERFEDEAINRANDILSMAVTLIFAGLLLLAFCWRRSPFYVPPMAE
jgi:membrane protease YdiL (CAAX protease family)